MKLKINALDIFKMFMTKAERQTSRKHLEPFGRFCRMIHFQMLVGTMCFV
jgi:hypothetical protein